MPIPFEYLEGRAYNHIGDKTIWIQASRSGWDKQQGTLQLTIFADGVLRVKPLLFFRGQGPGPTIGAERTRYDNRVVVIFNPTAYANMSNMLKWLDEQLVPVLEGQPTLLAIDLFSGHKTEEVQVLDTFAAYDITLSVIPGGCKGLCSLLMCWLTVLLKIYSRLVISHSKRGEGSYLSFFSLFFFFPIGGNG